MGRLGDHSIQRGNLAEKALAKYKENIDKYLRDVLKSGAYMIVKSAYMLRLGNKYAHNFTGNLVNSICAGVFYKGNLDYACFSCDLPGVKNPIMQEMSGNKGPEQYVDYHFPEDYEGEESDYAAHIPTDKTYGQIHAVDFINDYKPTSPYLEIVLAYTAAYSDYVDSEGHLGYDAAFRDFNAMFVSIQDKVKEGARFGNSHKLKQVRIKVD